MSLFLLTLTLTAAQHRPQNTRFRNPGFRNIRTPLATSATRDKQFISIPIVLLPDGQALQKPKHATYHYVGHGIQNAPRQNSQRSNKARRPLTGKSSTSSHVAIPPPTVPQQKKIAKPPKLTASQLSSHIRNTQVNLPKNRGHAISQQNQPPQKSHSPHTFEQTQQMHQIQYLRQQRNPTYPQQNIQLQQASNHKQNIANFVNFATNLGATLVSSQQQNQPVILPTQPPSAFTFQNQPNHKIQDSFLSQKSLLSNHKLNNGAVFQHQVPVLSNTQVHYAQVLPNNLANHNNNGFPAHHQIAQQPQVNFQSQEQQEQAQQQTQTTTSPENQYIPAQSIRSNTQTSKGTDIQNGVQFPPHQAHLYQQNTGNSLHGQGSQNNVVLLNNFNSQIHPNNHQNYATSTTPQQPTPAPHVITAYDTQTQPKTYEAQTMPKTYESQTIQKTYESQNLQKTYEAQSLPKTYETQTIPKTYETQTLPKPYDTQVLPKSIISVQQQQQQLPSPQQQQQQQQQHQQSGSEYNLNSQTIQNTYISQNQDAQQNYNLNAQGQQVSFPNNVQSQALGYPSSPTSAFSIQNPQTSDGPVSDPLAYYHYQTAQDIPLNFASLYNQGQTGYISSTQNGQQNDPIVPASQSYTVLPSSQNAFSGSSIPTIFVSSQQEQSSSNISPSSDVAGSTYDSYSNDQSTYTSATEESQPTYFGPQNLEKGFNFLQSAAESQASQSSESQLSQGTSSIGNGALVYSSSSPKQITYAQSQSTFSSAPQQFASTNFQSSPTYVTFSTAGSSFKSDAPAPLNYGQRPPNIVTPGTTYAKSNQNNAKQPEASETAEESDDSEYDETEDGDDEEASYKVVYIPLDILKNILSNSVENQ